MSDSSKNSLISWIDKWSISEQAKNDLLNDLFESSLLETKSMAVSTAKIVQLDPLIVQDPSDIYEVSADGSGSFKESRSQMVNYINQQLNPQTQIIRVDPNGSDINGNGQNIPYATISYALSQITDASISKPYLISSSGDFTDSSWLLKPNISHDFNGGTYTLSSNPQLDSSFNGAQSKIYIQNLSSINKVFNLDFSAISSPSTLNIFRNIIFSVNDEIAIKGNVSGGGTIFIAEALLGLSFLLDIHIENVYGALQNCSFNNIDHYLIGAQYSYVDCRCGADCTITSDTSSSSFELMSCVFPNLNLNGNGPGTLTVSGKGNDISNLTLEVTSGHPEYLDAGALDGLISAPILIGGAEYIPKSLALSINAGFNPAIYTPVDESVKGNLEGIDNEFNHPYQHEKIIDGDITVDQSIVGYCNISDDGVIYTITFPFNPPIDAFAQIEFVSGKTNNGLIFNFPNNSEVNGIFYPSGTTINVPISMIVDIRRVAANAYVMTFPSTIQQSAFFQIANNLSEINTDPSLSRGNLGLPSGLAIFDLDQDYTLSNPCPQLLYANMPTSGHVVMLPEAIIPGGLTEGNPISVVGSFNTQPLDIQNNIGQPIIQVNPGDIWILVPIRSSLSQLGWWATKSGGSGSAQNMQQTYDYGSTVNMAEDQPVTFSAGVLTPGNASYLTNLVSNSFAPAPSTSYVIGMSFTPNQNGYVSGLGYLDSVWASGVRQVGLWQYVTSTVGILLATANVAKSDPIDPQTNRFRIHSISPVAVSKGVRYVVAALNPTTDQWLIFQGPNPSFATVDGWSQYGFASGTLVYPPMNTSVPPGGTQFGNVDLQFQPASGYNSQFIINPKTINSVFMQVSAKDQATQPFGVGVSADLAAIDPSALVDGSMYNLVDINTIKRFTQFTSEWLTVGLGRQFVMDPSYQIIPGQMVFNYNIGLTSYVLPPSMNVGEMIKIIGYSFGGWTLAINAGQSIIYNGTFYTANAHSTTRSDCLTLTCVTQDTEFVAEPSGGTAFS